MNPNWSSSRLLTLARALWSGTAQPALVTLMLFSPFTVKAADAPGAIVGAVSNAATRNTLEGAAVSVPSLRVNVLTDNAGRYTIPSVPPGTYDVTVT
ncbi:MAG: carboxypeptidase regulatory-like domain-containing protein, partial [Verrucomicrobia bacterium]|nr:carboxypeptidase regulatory-like domain-containing protein [Verrucomicrobiota bacterium]